MQLQPNQQQVQLACRNCLSAQHSYAGGAKKCPLHMLLQESLRDSSKPLPAGAAAAAAGGAGEGDEEAGGWVTALGFDGVQLVGALRGLADELLGGEVEKLAMRAASAVKKRRQQQQQQQGVVAASGPTHLQQQQQQGDAEGAGNVLATAEADNDGPSAGMGEQQRDGAGEGAEVPDVAGAPSGTRRTRTRHRSASAEAAVAAAADAPSGLDAAAAGLSGRFGVDPWSFVAAAVLLQEVGRAVLEEHA
jgi:hypothetical protein